MSKSTGNTPTVGREMAQFSQKNIMGVAFDTTERLAELDWRIYNIKSVAKILSNRYTQFEPVGMGVSGLVWYDLPTVSIPEQEC